MRVHAAPRRAPFAAAFAVVVLSAAALQSGAGRVAGTKVELTPPEGFVAESRFPGYSHAASGGSIMVTEMPGPIDKLQAGLTKEGLASRGMTLIEATDMTIGDEPAKLIRVTQRAAGTAFEKWILTFGNENDSVFVVGTYLEGEAGSWREPVKAAVLSARRSSEAAPDRFEGLPFRLTESAGLRISNRVSSALLLTEGGAEGPVSPEDPLLVVGPSVAPADLSDLESFSALRLRQSAGVREMKNLEGREVKVDGLPGWELTADALDKDGETPLRLYQLVVADGSHYFLAQGQVGAARAGEFMPQFREIATGLRRARPQRDAEE